MKKCNAWVAIGCAVVSLAAFAGQARSQEAPAPAVVSAGAELFQKQFAAGEAIAPGGDGLGPVFNHVSCAACHHQGGLGGAGPVDVNAAMLSALPRKFATAPERADFRKLLERTHAGFLGEKGEITPNVILHRFSSTDKYAAMRHKLVGTTIPFKPTDDEREDLQQTLARVPVQPAAGAKGLGGLVVTQRNTTALFGAGLIDKVPDAVLHGLAAVQSNHPEISGRVPPIKITRAGRFGWRGQTERLHDFVLGACANELGLEVPGTQQPVDPLRPKYKSPGLDLTMQQCLSLTMFVASLPPPQFVPPDDAERRRIAEQGYKVFHSVGCSACHVENVGPIQGLYSDLLLHDMGPGLADPVLASATMRQIDQETINSEHHYKQEGRIISDDTQVAVRPNPVAYYGGSQQTIEKGTTFLTDSGILTTVVTSSTNSKHAIVTRYEPVKTNRDQEWRTPPLWGLADSGPYLHDGRAASVLEAIAQHGGEAEACLQRFLALETSERLAMLEFLTCLRAP
jgi:CxxC motif-containing protein (DUF1111 family)